MEPVVRSTPARLNTLTDQVGDILDALRGTMRDLPEMRVLTRGAIEAARHVLERLRVVEARVDVPLPIPPLFFRQMGAVEPARPVPGPETTGTDTFG